MKRMIAAGLAAVFSIALCTGCQSRRDGQEGRLKICTDHYSEDAVRNVIEAWQVLNDDANAELVLIPGDIAAAETKITQLRTEIMSGGGPDVFIFQCKSPYSEEFPVLFSDPEKSMYSETFLPLDEYMDEAQYMNTAVWNQTVLKSGQTEEGQLMLPIYYEYYAYAFRTADLESAGNLPSSWNELITCEDKVIEDSAANFLLGFHDIFGKIADYQGETLLLSEENLMARIEEAIQYTGKKWVSDETTKVVAKDWIGNFFLEALAGDRGQEHAIFAFPNEEGGMTANVTMYAAINRNTLQPEEAFSFLDVLFSDEVMSGEGFQVGERFYGSSFNPLVSGISVNNNALQAVCAQISSEDADAVRRIDDQISVVRYHSDLDRELYNLYFTCSNYRETMDENGRKELIRKTYDTLQMKLSE